MPNKKTVIEKLQKNEVTITEQVLLVVRNEQNKKVKEMKGFVDTMNRSFDSLFKTIEIQCTILIIILFYNVNLYFKTQAKIWPKAHVNLIDWDDFMAGIYQLGVSKPDLV